MRFFLIAILCGFLTGCGMGPSSAPTQPMEPSVTSQPIPVTPTVTPEPGLNTLQKLTIWIPAQFDPKTKSPAAITLVNAISEFENNNPGVTVEIRVKAESGPSGLMETLGLAAKAAPDAMPSLVLLSRSQMEDASSKKIIFPYEGLTTTLKETDWYPFAQELATIQGDMYGIPLSGNVLA
jgi:multiple sugar transport system substrate-binding protein